MSTARVDSANRLRTVCPSRKRRDQIFETASGTTSLSGSFLWTWLLFGHTASYFTCLFFSYDPLLECLFTALDCSVDVPGSWLFVSWSLSLVSSLHSLLCCFDPSVHSLILCGFLPLTPNFTRHYAVFDFWPLSLVTAVFAVLFSIFEL